MALDFPANPTNGQSYGSYVYNSTVGAWQSKEDPATVAITSPTAPASANNGDIWYNTNTGVSYVYYNDGTSAQWVEVVSSALPALNSKANLVGDNWFSGGVNYYGPGNLEGTFISSNTGRAQLTVNNPAAIPLTVKGTTSQAADLQQWQNSGGTVLSEVDSTGVITAPRLISTQATGTAPFTVSSTTAVTNLNADLLDGNHASAFATLSGASFTGAITSTAGPGGIVLKAGSTLDHAYMELYADSQAQSTRSGWFGYGTVNSPNMTISNEMANGNLSLLVNGTGQVNLPTKTYMPGAIVQAIEVRGSAGDKSASTSIVDIISTTFTTKLAGSKLLLTWHSGQMSLSGPQVNPMIYFTIDGTDISDFTTNHYFYGDNNTAIFRPVVTIPIMTGVLTQGAHTVKVRGQAYNGTVTYDFQSNSSPERRGRLIIMEVAQ